MWISFFTGWQQSIGCMIRANVSQDSLCSQDPDLESARRWNPVIVLNRGTCRRGHSDASGHISAYPALSSSSYCYRGRLHSPAAAHGMAEYNCLNCSSEHSNDAAGVPNDLVPVDLLGIPFIGFPESNALGSIHYNTYCRLADSGIRCRLANPRGFSCLAPSRVSSVCFGGRSSAQPFSLASKRSTEHIDCLGCKRAFILFPCNCRLHRPLVENSPPVILRGSTGVACFCLGVHRLAAIIWAACWRMVSAAVVPDELRATS